MDGEIVEIQADTNEAILIAQGWQAHIQGGVPKDGYIAKGLSKYGFRVRVLISFRLVFLTDSCRGASETMPLPFSNASQLCTLLSRMVLTCERS
jgi:hypothetical protein